MTQSSLNYLMMSQSFLQEEGSSPVVGSSRIKILGFKIKAIARQNFHYSPYESLDETAFSLLERPTYSRTLIMFSFQTNLYFILITNSRFSFKVKLMMNTLSCVQNPTLLFLISFQVSHAKNLFQPWFYPVTAT